MDDGSNWTSRHDGVAKCSNSERGLHPVIERVANNAVGVDVFDGAAVELALTRSVLSDVGQPDLVRSRSREVTLQQVIVNWRTGTLGIGLLLGKSAPQLLLTAEAPDAAL